MTTRHPAQASEATAARVLVWGLPQGVAEHVAQRLPGAAVDVAAGMLDARRLAASRSYRLVVADFAQLQQSGPELLRSVRGGPERSAPLICVLDAVLDAALARQIRTQDGISRLFVQPLDLDQLVEHAATLLQLPVEPAPDPEWDREARTREGLAALWSRFSPAMLQRVHRIRDAAEAVRQGRLKPELRRHAEREAHKLAGSLGTFGLMVGTRLAREAEALLAGDGALDAAGVTRLAEIAAVLQTVVEVGPREGTPLGDGAPPRLLILEPDDAFREQLRVAAAAQGFTVDAVASLTAARAALLRARPAVAIVDLAAEEHASGGLSLLHPLAGIGPPVPVVALTPRSFRVDHVQSVRLGVRNFLQKPVTAEQVVAELDAVLQQIRAARPRVLAVDDDPALLASVRLLLAGDGFEVRCLEDPLELWGALDDFCPDLVILDVEMPALTGIELCRVLRNDPRWCTLPVLFLTARTDSTTIHRVFAAGGDDFVTKPVVGPELLTRIRNRLERLALLRTLSDLDGLTGAANRRRTMELLDQLMRLAHRQRHPFCFALLDLDHFKAVNDRHGHAVGDQVLHAFGEYLRRHFRDEDVVGRWGGEEFALGLYGIRRAHAAARVSRALESFARESFHGRDGQEFHVTASGGVAEFPVDGARLEELYRAADDALYRAKRAGRRRVEQAGPATDP